MLCRKIGTPKQISSRRDMFDISELLENQVRKGSGDNQITGSEHNVMMWSLIFRVILGHTQVSALQQGKTFLNLCDSFESSPAGSNQIKVIIRERLPRHVNRSRKDASSPYTKHSKRKSNIFNA